MSNNRDYKTSARAATKRLAEHHRRMMELQRMGMTREAASAQALTDMKTLDKSTAKR